MGMLSSVSPTSFWSGTLAPATATARGTPRPSISVERLTPSLPRSVGFFPVFFPTQRRLGHRPVHALPFPIDAFQLVVLGQSELPELLEHAQPNPLLKIRVDRAAGAELLRHRLPLAACGQDVQDATHDVLHGQSWAATFTTAIVNWDHEVDPFPQSLGDLVKP